MKGFVKKGLVLLALGVLFAGCASPSSQEGSASNGGGGNGDVNIPMTLDPVNHKLTIGDGSGPFVGVFKDPLGNGHTVEVANGTTSAAGCEADGNGSRCWVRVTNRDTDEYMANVFVAITRCDSCDTGLGGNYQMDNFDASWPGGVVDNGIYNAQQTINVVDAYTVLYWKPPLYKPTSTATPLPGYGIAYVMDTANPEAIEWPMNPFGARLRDLPTTQNVKPEWMISPACGAYSEMWDFGGTSSTLFPFVATVKATWFQMNPFGEGSNGVRGGGDDDPRYDFRNFTTIFLTITDLVASATDSTYRKFYRPGTVYRSNVLAGYKPSWARGVGGKTIADINYTGGQKYFAVNVGFEASDRIESQSFGRKADPFHEYYNMVAIITTYNPAIVQEIRSGSGWLLTKAGGTRFQNKANSPCVLQSECGGGSTFLDNADTPRYMDTQIDTNLTSVSVTDKGGYIATISENVVYTESAFWSYFTSGEYYTQYDLNTETSNKLGTTGVAFGEIPKTFFFHGFAKIVCMDIDNETCVQQDGPDPEPEFWPYNFVLKVLPGKVGLGTEIKLDVFSTYTFFQTYTTNSGFDQSGGALLPRTDAGPNSPDDWIAYYIVDGSTNVVGGAPIQELSNKKIRHRGPAVSENNRGTFQAWNVAVCIK